MRDLTDEDIYTYVTLKDCELPVRKGSLTPINEGYANAGGAHRCAKYATLMRDINGNSMYIYTNTTCLYRRDGTRLPYGSGNMSGVIVHELFTRFEYLEAANGLIDEEKPATSVVIRFVTCRDPTLRWQMISNSFQA